MISKYLPAVILFTSACLSEEEAPTVEAADEAFSIAQDHALCTTANDVKGVFGRALEGGFRFLDSSAYTIRTGQDLCFWTSNATNRARCNHPLTWTGYVFSSGYDYTVDNVQLNTLGQPKYISGTTLSWRRSGSNVYSFSARGSYDCSCLRQTTNEPVCRFYAKMMP